MERNRTEKWLARLLRVALLFVLQSSFLVSNAQEAVPLCSDWVATVDEQTQNIVLRWRPSPDSAVMGYHICSGTPCLDYDTVFGRLDTTYICLDHSPLERHSYRLHVFDSAYNVSRLTPPFGNIVLTADIPECESQVTMEWTPYDSMPGGLGGYRLMARLEPIDTGYVFIAAIPADGQREYTIDLPDVVTKVSVKVMAFNQTGTVVSQSNIVSAERQTIRHANSNSITAISFDTVMFAVKLELKVDTAYSYTVWRSIDGSPWSVIDSVRSATPSLTYVDRNITKYGLLHCYQLSVKDECGINEQFSSTVWITVPEPPPIAIAIPNIIIVGSEDNGVFRPRLSGTNGELYELSIYNRNGMLVYRTEDMQAAWRPPDDCQQGAYTYHLRVRFNNNRIHTYVGTFVLVR